MLGRGVATGRGLGEDEAARAETIYLEHEEQLGREASSAAFQGQVGREEGMLGAKVASSPCPLPTPSPHLPCSLGMQPSSHHPGRSPLSATPLVSRLGLSFPVGHPTRPYVLSTAGCMVHPHHVPGIARSFHLMTM